MLGYIFLFVFMHRHLKILGESVSESQVTCHLRQRIKLCYSKEILLHIFCFSMSYALTSMKVLLNILQQMMTLFRKKYNLIL